MSRTRGDSADVWRMKAVALEHRINRLELCVKLLLRATKPLVTTDGHSHGCGCKGKTCYLRHEAQLIAAALLEGESP